MPCSAVRHRGDVEERAGVSRAIAFEAATPIKGAMGFPPPCGEGMRVGVARIFGDSLTLFVKDTCNRRETPTPAPPPKGEGKNVPAPNAIALKANETALVAP